MTYRRKDVNRMWPDPEHVCDVDKRWAEYDGYGIFLCYVCDLCVKQKMARYRPDIKEQYQADEPIEPEE